MFTNIFIFIAFFLSDDESENVESGYGSSGTCPFPFSSGNYVGCVSGGGSGVFVLTEIESIGEMMKCYFPFCDGEMVKCSFPFCDGEMVKFSSSVFEGEILLTRLLEIFSRSKSFIVSNSFLKI